MGTLKWRRADFAEDVAEIGGDGEVAILEELVGRERGPVAVDFAALDRAAHGEEAGAVAVIGAAIAVLVHGAAELAHGDDDDIGHAVAEVLMQRGQRLREAAEPGGELALGVALVGVGVPAVDLGEGDLHADVGLDQLRDLLEVAAEGALRINGAVGRAGSWRSAACLSRSSASNDSRAVPCRTVSTAAPYMLSKPLVVPLGPDSVTEVSPARPKVSRSRMARESCSPWRLRGMVARHGDGAEGGLLGGVLRAAAEQAVEPAVLHAAVFVDARFHQVLRIEMGARGVGRAAGLDGREMALLVRAAGAGRAPG